MLNITLAGNIFDSTETQYPLNEVKYQAFFYSTNSFSSANKWNDTRLSENGQYNINLGDGDFLTQAGIYNSDDKVIICFWVDSTKNRNALDLTEWCFIEILLSDLSVYQNDAQTFYFQDPSCSFITTDNIILDNVATTNHQNWLFHGTEQYQDYERYNEEMFFLMSFDSDCVVIDWGDLVVETVDLEDEYYHSYVLAGEYHIIVKVYNRGNLFCQSEFDIQASFTIINGLIWVPPVYKGTTTTYTPTITGDTEQIIKVSYLINNILTYDDMDYDESFDHIFTTFEPHEITQVILYDNIYAEVVQSETYTIYLDSIANFYKEDGVCGARFVDNSNIGNGPVTNYYWGVKYDGSIVAEISSNDVVEWEYNWPYEGIFTIIHKITDTTGSEFGIERIYDIETCYGSSASSGGSDNLGGGNGWVETKYIERKFPKLKVKKIKEIDEKNINMSIKLIS